MSLSLSATSGSFVNTIPTSQLVDTSETFNHDDDDSTDELAVFSFSIGENDIYFTESNSVVTVVNPKNKEEDPIEIHLALVQPV